MKRTPEDLARERNAVLAAVSESAAASVRLIARKTGLSRDRVGAALRYWRERGEVACCDRLWRTCFMEAAK